jgi:hypothetical protein
MTAPKYMGNDTGNDNPSNVTEQTPEDVSTIKEQLERERAEKAELAEKNRQLFERAKKAEGYTKDTEGNWSKVEKEAPKSKAKPTDELDYGQKAYLKASGVETTEFDFVKQHLTESGKDLDALLASKYFQSELKEFRDKKSTENASPSPTRTTVENPQSKVEYWIARKELPADPALRLAVVNRRIEMERSAYNQ